MPHFGLTSIVYRAYNRQALQLGFSIGLLFLRVGQVMRHAILGNAYRRVLTVQVIVVVVFALIALFWHGQFASVSALSGGFIIIAGNLAYAMVARPSKVDAKSGNQVLLRHVLAELAKILFVVGLMSAAFVSDMFDAVWLIAALGVALLGHGLSLLLSK